MKTNLEILKRILKLNKVLFLISFFTPFLFFPSCGLFNQDSKKEAMERALRDSVRLVDSINIAQLKLKGGTTSTIYHKADTSIIRQKIKLHNSKNYLKSFWLFLNFPTDNSVSAFCIARVGLDYFFKFPLSKNKRDFIYPFALFVFIISVIGFIFVFFKNKFRVLFYLSLSGFFFLLLISLTHPADMPLLWGYWVMVLINVIDIVVLTVIKKNLQNNIL